MQMLLKMLFVWSKHFDVSITNGPIVTAQSRLQIFLVTQLYERFTSRPTFLIVKKVNGQCGILFFYFPLFNLLFIVQRGISKQI